MCWIHETLWSNRTPRYLKCCVSDKVESFMCKYGWFYGTAPNDTAYKQWTCQVIKTCKLLSTHPSKPFPGWFSGSESVCHNKADSSKPQRPSDTLRSWLCIMISGDIHPNPGTISIHVRCVLAMSQVVGWVIYAIVVLDGYIQSVLVFKMQQSTDKLRTGYTALAVIHPLYQNHSSTTDTKGDNDENMISGSNFGILNWDSPTRLPGNAHPYSPDVSLASASRITYTNWQKKTNLCSDHLSILIILQMGLTINPIPHRTSFNLNNANWDIYC